MFLNQAPLLIRGRCSGLAKHGLKSFVTADQKSNTYAYAVNCFAV